MPFREWLQPPRHLLLLFLLVTLLLTGTLIWLSWQLVRQDEALVGQRIEERRENAADLAVAALQKSLSQFEEQLTALGSTPAGELQSMASEYAKRLGQDAVLVVFRPGGVEAFPRNALRFHPSRPAEAAPARGVFARAESLEFGPENYPEAIAILRQQASSAELPVRAGALMRLARVFRKSKRLPEALSAYQDLAGLGLVPVEGLPADLAARHGRLSVLEDLGEKDRLAREASALSADLQAGQWRLTRAEYGFYLEETQRRLGVSDPWSGTEAAVARASAVESMWEQWQAARPGGLSTKGQRTLWFAERPVLALWRASPESLVGLAAGPDYVESQWLARLQPTLAQQGVGIALADTDGRPVIGRPPSGGDRQSLRLASATQLPWNVHAITLDTGSGLAFFEARRRVLLAALLVVALLILTGSYFIWRSVARELAVSRLQSDFVSAVSHEFRTPLTALRQFSELLVNDRVATGQERRQFYEGMAHESRRLDRLVERLLHFGRMEAGALQYRFERLDLAALVREVVAEFERGAEALGYQIELSADGPAMQARADRDTLGCVIWNLLDNAVKYSPDCTTVWVELGQEGESVAVRVRDHGLGIPPGEQKEIFRKFVRGLSAEVRSIRGTGIGLAVARQIVVAHGGRIKLESKPGEGSTFTVLLPRAD
jgi:signal transduction histidine kinase